MFFGFVLAFQGLSQLFDFWNAFAVLFHAEIDVVQIAQHTEPAVLKPVHVLVRFHLVDTLYHVVQIGDDATGRHFIRLACLSVCIVCRSLMALYV